MPPHEVQNQRDKARETKGDIEATRKVEVFILTKLPGNYLKSPRRYPKLVIMQTRRNFRIK